MAASTIPLTEHMHVTNGTHILYFYETMEAYLDNAISFMLTGFQQGQHIIYVDSRERYEIVKQRLRAQVSERELRPYPVCRL
ncbi:MEDS domain-containing protein [Paenibacillus sp. TAB 01]|uniref:MEDS domain-containing protein n=1 Tax=Paenibacillus sp. TAB 01 TaxID=3368988 RepID=UPI003750DB57